MASAPEGRRPPPSRLDLKRQAAELQDALSRALGARLACELSWAGVADRGEAMRRLEDLLRVTGEALADLAQDPLAKKALVGLRKVRLGVGSGLAATRKGSSLTVTATAGDGPGGRLSKGSLQSVIEAAL